jgi:hypothetical protein
LCGFGIAVCRSLLGLAVLLIQLAYLAFKRTANSKLLASNFAYQPKHFCSISSNLAVLAVESGS